jgi:hypothetical protein
MIIETSDNRFYTVWPTMVPGMDHVWNGYPVKPDRKANKWVLTAAGRRAHDANRPQLVRKAAARVVEA